MKETFNFGKAIELMQDGKFVAREGWNGKGMYLGIQIPDEHSANRQPYIWIMPKHGRVPWVASQTDILAEDWSEVTMAGGAGIAPVV